MATKKNAVIEAEVIEELPLEKVIDNTLAKHNVTDAVIAELKEKYGSLKLAYVGDTEGYLNIKDARKEVRKLGVLTEKYCKMGREDAIRIQKLWLAKEKEVLGKIAEVQDPLDAEIKKYEDEQDRIETERKNRQEEAYMKRQAELSVMGAVFANGCFNLNEVSYEMSAIKEADDDVYTNLILPKFKKEYEANNAAKAEQERLKKEAEEKLRQEQEEFRKQQEEFNKQRQEAERIRLEREAEESRKAAEEQRLKHEAENILWRSRLGAMNDAGWNGHFAFSKHGDQTEPVFTYEELITLSEAEFTQRAKVYNDGVKEILAKKEEENQKRIEQEKQLAIEQAKQQERQRLEEQARQDELKRQQEEAQKLEEQAKAKDKEKWAMLLKAINELQLPEFKSSIYKGKLNILKEKFEEINDL